MNPIRARRAKQDGPPGRSPAPARGWLDDWCEKGILGLVLVLLIYTPLALGTVHGAEFAVVQWLTVGLLALWLVRFTVNPKHRLLWIPLSWPVLVFALYAVGRYLAADVEYVARQELLRVLVYTAVFFAVVNNLHRPETTQILGLTLIILATALSIYAVIQFFTSSDEVWSLAGQFSKPDNYRKRGSGTFLSPNNLAGYLEMVLPIAIAFMVTGRFSLVQKIFLGYACLVIFAGLSVTISRGGWLGGGLSLVVLFYYLVRQRDYWRRALLVVVFLGGIFAFFWLKAELSPNRSDGFERAHEIEDVRFKLWGPALDMWLDHFWFGVGPNHFNERYRQYRAADPDTQIQPDRAHNDYLNTLSDWGLVGAVLVAACWGVFYFQVFRSWRPVQRLPNEPSARRSNRSAFFLGGAVGLFALLVHAVVDFNFHVPANALLAVVLLGVIGAHYRFATERPWRPVGLGLRIPINAVLTLLVLYLIGQAWILGRESAVVARARDATTSAAREALLRRAAAISPANPETAFAVGELLRLRSFEGGDGYRDLANEAIVWFQRAAALHRYDPNPLVRLGMCLDWLDQHEQAALRFEQAVALDPNSYLTLAYLGWHHFQLKEYSAARKLFHQSISLASLPEKNPIAYSYLRRIPDESQRSTPSR